MVIKMGKNIKGVGEKRKALVEVYRLRDRVIDAINNDDIYAYNHALVVLYEYVKNIPLIVNPDE
jgi:hypothetical protein